MMLVGFIGTSYAQEFLTGLSKNVEILKQAKELSHQAKKENTPIFLPFFEDFSNYTGYPNDNLFVDKQAFVNQTFPLRPPTIGVVTLDALNEYGKIYPHLNATPKGADTLTSRYIRLDSMMVEGVLQKITIDNSLFFSFYFQSGGAALKDSGSWTSIGNQPDINDSLVLEFGHWVIKEDTAYTQWNHIWSTPGFNISTWISENPHQYFKQIMIPIVDEKYLCDKFQFRFRNYASLEPQQGIAGWEGNVDQWHIDYIRLDANRTSTDTYTNDLAFVNPTTSFLKEPLQAMPWRQFRPDKDVKSSFGSVLTNLFNNSLQARYRYYITQNGDPITEYDSIVNPATEGVYSYSSRGVYHKNSKINPNAFKPLREATTFKITHVFQNASGIEHDFCTANDTCFYEQKFQNYYAYDDGTAEYGYCLNNQYTTASLAMKFSLNYTDTLSAVKMWFNQTKNSENAGATFNLVVWKDNNNQPGEEIYRTALLTPDTAVVLDFVVYPFDRKIVVSGDFWVGFEQQGNVQLNIGFDQNTDSRAFFKYNTRGMWESSIYKGTPMLRPVFGTNPLSICCSPSPPSTTVKPNPAKDWVYVVSNGLPITNVEVFDILGRKVQGEGRKEKGERVAINISHLTPGVYFLRVIKENKSVETVKLIKN